MKQLVASNGAIFTTAFNQRVVKATGLRRGGDVVIDELTPLHDQHGELLGIGWRFPVNG